MRTTPRPAPWILLALGASCAPSETGASIAAPSSPVASSEVAEVDLDLEVGVPTQRESVAAPTVPPTGRRRERMHSVLGGSVEFASISGRVLGVDGEPVANAWFAMACDPPVSSISEERDAVRTDELGRFECEGLVPIGWADALVLSVLEGGSPELGAAVSFAAPDECVPVEVGDVRLEPIVPIVAGVLRDVDGSVVQNEYVGASHRYDGLPDMAPVARLLEVEVATDANGRFELLGLAGATPGASLFLRAGTGRDRWTDRTVPVGTLDADLAFEPASRLPIRLEGDVDLKRAELRLELRDPLDGSRWRGRVDEGGVAKWSSLPEVETVVDFAVLSHDSEEPLAWIPGITVPADGYCRDPRIFRVDVRGRLKAVQVRVEDPAGEPVSAVHVMELEPNFELHGSTGSDGVVELMGVAWPKTIRVKRRGWTEQVIPHVGADIVVTLEPEPE